MPIQGPVSFVRESVSQDDELFRGVPEARVQFLFLRKFWLGGHDDACRSHSVLGGFLFLGVEFLVVRRIRERKFDLVGHLVRLECRDAVGQVLSNAASCLRNVWRRCVRAIFVPLPAVQDGGVEGSGKTLF